MNRLIKIAWVVLLCPLFLVSCSSDDEGEKKIDLTFNAVPRVSGALDIASLAGTPVKFTEVRSQNTSQFPLDATGKRGLCELTSSQCAWQGLYFQRGFLQW